MAVQIDRAICMHIPKTGGTFVRHYLQQAGLDHGVEKLLELAHMNSIMLRSLIGDTDDLKFCFVRHPLTWYRSYWESKQRIKNRGGGPIDEIVDLPWSDFIDIIIEEMPGYLTGFYFGYTEICRVIGKQENLRSDLSDILRLLRIPYDKNFLFTMPAENVVPSDKKYSLSQIKAIMELESEIIKQFDYNYIPEEVIDWTRP